MKLQKSAIIISLCCVVIDIIFFFSSKLRGPATARLLSVVGARMLEDVDVSARKVPGYVRWRQVDCVIDWYRETASPFYEELISETDCLWSIVHLRIKSRWFQPCNVTWSRPFQRHGNTTYYAVAACFFRNVYSQYATNRYFGAACDWTAIVRKRGWGGAEVDTMRRTRAAYHYAIRKIK